MKNIDEIKEYSLYDPKFEHDACGVGFVCSIDGVKSNKIIKDGIAILNNLAHRGATGADPLTGDGAGLLIQIPHRFIQSICGGLKLKLPEPGSYGSGMVFFSRDEEKSKALKDIFHKIAADEALEIIGWRSVPVDNSVIGVSARSSEPVIEQIFVKEKTPSSNSEILERKLYVFRKSVESAAREAAGKSGSFFYITNISSRTLSYKGLLTPGQIASYFLDLKSGLLESAICLVHSRYSTNTFPTWDLAQPFRFLAHNGEINTLRGNINWMRSKESMLKSALFGASIEKLKPVIVAGGSDSAMLDNVFELLTLSGRSLAHAMMMLVPSAWEHNEEMPAKHRDFYKYHNCLMEPWDGPAAVAFTDGRDIGAVLDRNGLRPARYFITKDNYIVMASEAGVLEIEPSNILYSGRLEPGKMLYVDTVKGEVIDDSRLKDSMAQAAPYSEWLKENIVEFASLRAKGFEDSYEGRDLFRDLKEFGYSKEDLKLIIKPMIEDAQEPIGSMGNDAPPAILSKKPQIIYNYFKQLFAQVTNPPIDSIREEIVMSLDCFLGNRMNLLDESKEHCRKIHLTSPILSNEDLHKLKNINENGFNSKTISILFSVSKHNDFFTTLDRICHEAFEAVASGCDFLILSDRGTTKELAALPALIAVGAVHQYLVKKCVRAQTALIIESAEPREVHHFGVLFGFGAGCVNPYLAYEAAKYIARENRGDITADDALCNYRKAVNKGLMKIMSRMGISTLQSYRGAQIFEVLGLAEDVMEKCFAGAVSRIGGASLNEIMLETLERHKEAHACVHLDSSSLSSGGVYQWRKDGEYHLWNPQSISALQESARKKDASRYNEFAELINDQSKNPATIRSLFKFKPQKPIVIDEVEPAENILKRFVTGAMSFGSISKEAHETLAVVMNRLGGRSNTGEGGEAPERFVPLSNGDSKRSAIKQVASGRFGVNTNYLVNADEIQIKIAQGAKPGEGGQLPGHKVSAIIARIRYTTKGVTLISPPPHHDIYSIEDLAQLIFDLKNVNPRARISVKLVSEIGVGTVAAGVAKGHADMILVSGGDGGTGASPLSSIKHAGIPWELGLSETHQTLVLNDLRSRVRLQTDGQMRTGRDVVIAAILGAEEYGFCTTVLVVMGCVMLRHCHLNNCSVGVATQEDILQKRFAGKADHIINYFQFVADEARSIMAQLGIKSIDDLIGRTELLDINKEIMPLKAKGLDLSRILYKPVVADSVGIRKLINQNHNIDKVLDLKLIELSQPALNYRKEVQIQIPIANSDRAVGAMLSGELCKTYGEKGLSTNTINCRFKGTAGQSFGAFLANGISFELEGMANDYVGKGISGGKIVIYADRNARYEAGKNVIIGNTAFYGAISGEAYISGVAGERFCIRNSGLNAVVEGVGDHGCEYMTGGRVIIIGKTGRNFAAGMSGGIAYVYDDDSTFKKRCNLSMVAFEKFVDEDFNLINRLLGNHYKYTSSKKAKFILGDFSSAIEKFVKVMPVEYKRVLEPAGEVSNG